MKKNNDKTRLFISEALGGIDTRYIQEAGQYTAPEKTAPAGKPAATANRTHLFFRAAAAAALALCLIAAGAGILSPSDKMTVTAHAQGTDEEITAAGAVVSTGSINDSGSMTGKPLFFYLSGKNIARVRFSCKNQQLCFMDWTEKRNEFGLAQNFTVEYGGDESEYYYLLIDWVPDAIVQKLHTGCTIAGLPEEMRSDMIVMEITFADGGTDTKAISISLLDNGAFFASFDDYRIRSTDTFVRRADSQPIPRDILYSQGSGPKEDLSGNAPAIGGEYQRTDPEPGLPENADSELPLQPGDARIAEAEEAAKGYYAGTVFQVVSMEIKSVLEDTVVFSVRASKGGIVQEPDRTITLQLKDGAWQVTGEGY